MREAIQPVLKKNSYSLDVMDLKFADTLKVHITLLQCVMQFHVVCCILDLRLVSFSYANNYLIRRTFVYQFHGHAPGHT